MQQYPAFPATDAAGEAERKHGQRAFDSCLAACHSVLVVAAAAVRLFLVSTHGCCQMETAAAVDVGAAAAAAVGVAAAAAAAGVAIVVVLAVVVAIAGATAILCPEGVWLDGDPAVGEEQAVADAGEDWAGAHGLLGDHPLPHPLSPCRHRLEVWMVRMGQK